MNNKYLIITNNPSVWESYNSKFCTEFVEGAYIDVLVKVRNKIHEGSQLITHPLMGSVKPNETPYRSIILQNGSNTDMQSVEIIESSIESCLRFQKDRPTPNWSDKVLKDFQFVDIRLFESAISSLPDII